MITDNIKNKDLYVPVHPKFKEAFEYLSITDFSLLKDGKYEISEDDIFAIVNSYLTSNDNVWEAHKKYVDIQYIVSGEEKFGFTNINLTEEIQQYDYDKDFALFTPGTNFINLRKGQFIIFFPEDVHSPGNQVDKRSDVKKVVVKVKF